MVAREWGEFVYASPDSVRETQIILDKDEAHHLFRVRRVRFGETVWVTTGAGTVYECEVGQIPNPKPQIPNSSQTLHVVRSHSDFGEPPIHITIGMAVLKGDANREVVDVATQLGVRGIVFFQGERSEGRLAEDRLEKLRRTAITATKQCGRAWLPEIRFVSNLRAVLSQVSAESNLLIANPESDPSAASVTDAVLSKKTVVLVGPEGGFTPQERQMAVEAGALSLHLGGRRLRAETAVAAGVSYLLTQAKEMRIREPK